MRVFLDERRLADADLQNLLMSWLEVADFALENSRGVSRFLDKQALTDGEFLTRLNRLRRDLRTLFLPMLFGNERIQNWRQQSIGMDALCQLATEAEMFADCAICETYEHHKAS